MSALPDAGAEGVAPGFAARGRLRRRVRFLRKARELAYRDLGGLVYNLHRFGQRNDQLVLGKLTTLGHIDTELRTLESALQERQPVTVLREAGLTACPRCAAIHSSEDRFCPNCGLPLARNVDLPIAGQAPAPAGAAVPGSRAPLPPAPGAAAPARASAVAAASPPGRAPTSPATTASPARAPMPPAPASPGRAPMPPARSEPSPRTPPPPAPGGPGPHAPPSPTASPPGEHAADDEPTEVVRPSSGGS